MKKGEALSKLIEAYTLCTPCVDCIAKPECKLKFIPPNKKSQMTQENCERVIRAYYYTVLED